MKKEAYLRITYLEPSNFFIDVLQLNIFFLIVTLCDKKPVLVVWSESEVD